VKALEEFPKNTPIADEVEMFLKFRKPRSGGNVESETKPHVDFLSERFFIIQFFEDYCRKHQNIQDGDHQKAKIFSDAFSSWKIGTVEYLEKKHDKDSRDLAIEVSGITYDNLSTYADNTIEGLQIILQKIPEKSKVERGEIDGRIKKWKTLSRLVGFANTYDRLK